MVTCVNLKIQLVINEQVIQNSYSCVLYWANPLNVELHINVTFMINRRGKGKGRFMRSLCGRVLENIKIYCGLLSSHSSILPLTFYFLFSILSVEFFLEIQSFYKIIHYDIIIKGIKMLYEKIISDDHQHFKLNNLEE